MLFFFCQFQGAQNIIYSATDSTNTNEINPENGYYVRNCSQIKSKFPFSNEVSGKLWQECEKLTANVAISNK